jgi:hypothetical protein
MDLTKANEAGKKNYVVKMTKSGLSDAHISNALGVSAGFIAKAKRKAGMIPLTKTELNHVQRLAAEGLSDHQIAVKMGLKYEPTEAEKAARADVLHKTQDLAKSLRKEDASSYVPRFCKQLIDLGIEEQMIRSCFTSDQQGLVTNTLRRFSTVG